MTKDVAFTHGNSEWLTEGISCYRKVGGRMPKVV